MTPQSFTQWRERLNLTRIEAARLLGVHRDTVLKWENGVNPISSQTELACQELVRRLTAKGTER